MTVLFIAWLMRPLLRSCVNQYYPSSIVPIEGRFDLRTIKVMNDNLILTTLSSMKVTIMELYMEICICHWIGFRVFNENYRTMSYKALP